MEPVLFNILINALEKRVNSKMIIFADYINLFKIVNINTDRRRVAEVSDDMS